jgi:serine/threonine protein kinase
MGNEIYIQKTKDDECHEFMHILKGTFIMKKESVTTVLDSQEDETTLYPIKIGLSYLKSRVVYFTSENKMEIWFKVLQEASGNADITDYYEFKENLGKGQFGHVKRAVNLKTKMEVAVKQIKKKKISSEELEMLRNEMEVLKICQHPNIVSLIDIFEDSKSIYIVLELLNGGDLYNYMEDRDFNLQEKRVKEIVFQIAQGL